MKIYVLYEKETGRIVHTHTEVVEEEDAGSSEEELLALYRSRAEDAPSDLNVLEVDPKDLARINEPRNVYVDVERGGLAERAPEE